MVIEQSHGTTYLAWADEREFRCALKLVSLYAETMSSDPAPDERPSQKRTAPRGPRDDRGVIAERILAAARASFAELGYAGTTLRSVARQADVDPALVSYYFKTKTGLLEAALIPPEGWTASLAEAAASPVKERGKTLVRMFIGAWEDPATAEYLRSVILTAAHEPVALQHLTANFARYILQAVSAHLDDADRFTRASLAASQMVGLAMTRYVWKVGAIAQMSSEDVVRYIAPTIQKYLTGRLTS
jgi:AcrR family transcriptional regulator